MRNKIINGYYDFFDKQIGDSTLVVAIIWIMIFLAWFLGKWWALEYKANILEYNNQNYDNIVYINGKKYKFLLQELK